MTNETKRPAESPEFNERADEDNFFAAKDHELVDAMKVEYLARRAARRAIETATCPKCLGKFQKFEILGFIIDRCENCQGVWLNKGELDGILRQKARGPLGAFFDRCFSNSKNSTKG